MGRAPTHELQRIKVLKKSQLCWLIWELPTPSYKDLESIRLSVTSFSVHSYWTMSIGPRPGYLHFSNSSFYLSPQFMLPCLISTDIYWVSWIELWAPNVSCKVLTLEHRAQFIFPSAHDTYNPRQYACYSHGSCVWILRLLISTGSLSKITS